MRVTRSNTILYCTRWKESVAFYRDVLELPIAMRNDWFVEFRLTDGAMLSIVDQARATINSAHGDGLTMSLHVEDVDETRETLKDRGCSPGPMRSIWGARAFYVHDPENTRLEFWGT